MRLQPFAALRPPPDRAERVASVPYDVVDRREAAALAAGNPLSFLHVVRAEIDLPADVDPYDDRVYATARANLQRLRDAGALVQEPEPVLFAYRLQAGDHVQTGAVGCVHIDDYEQGVIRVHERTRPVKENDRTRHILELNADAEPVLLTYRGSAAVDRLLAAATAAQPLLDFRAADGVRHTVWRVADPQPLQAAFGAVSAAYVADGHHRCAAAWRAGAERRAAAGRSSGEEPFCWFPAALFPAEQLRILPYNRLVADLGSLEPRQLLERLAAVGELSAPAPAAPSRPGRFHFYLAGTWHQLVLDPASIDRSDCIESLDVQLLQARVLSPILGIADPRTDPRLEFVGGSRGTAELQRRVDAGEAALAVSLYPTTIEQLLAVADAGQIMPPKSTWFEPKLRSGLFVHLLA